MDEPTVTLDLNWSYGIRTRPGGPRTYYGPGRVTVPLSIARRLGYQEPADGEEVGMAEQTFNWDGEHYTMETLPDAPREFLEELERRGALPAGVEVPAGNAPHRLGAVSGVGDELAAVLREHGIETVQALADADEATLVAVPGIGKTTAPRLKEAAATLLD